MSDREVLSPKEFTSAVESLRELIPDEKLDQLQPAGPATVYTTMVTIWMMVLQRLGGGKSLAATVKAVLANNRALLPDNKRLRENTLSESSGAYSQARTRLELDTVRTFADHVCGTLIDTAPPWSDGRRAFILDGTTITLPPTPELQAAFPPATNQHGETVWPVALLLMVHELQSSCALPPEIGAMYGEHNTSEAELSKATSHWNKNELAAKLQENGVAAAALLDFRELLTSPHLRDRGMIQNLCDSATGWRTWIRTFPGQIEGCDLSIPRPAPMLGEHNEEVLSELLGLSAQEIEALERDQIIGQRPFDAVPEMDRLDPKLYSEYPGIREYDPDYRQRLGLDVDHPED